MCYDKFYNIYISSYFGYIPQYSILFPPLKMEQKVSCPPFFPHREMTKNSSLFSSPPHLDFEANFPPGASGTISTLKMSQMVEILLSDLVLIVN